MKIIKSTKNNTNIFRIANKDRVYSDDFVLLNNGQEIKEHPKSKLSASDAVSDGKYKLYVSSNTKELYSDIFNNDLEALILGDGGDFASINYHNGKFASTDHTFVISYEHQNNLYMYYYWKYHIKDIDHCFQGTKLKNLKKPFFRKMKIAVHKDIKKQEKIASVLSQQEEQVNKIKTLIEKLEKRNQYYAERLLSGELRVREGDDGKIEFYENTEWKTISSNLRKNGELQSPVDWISTSLENIFTNSVGGEYGKELTDDNINLKTNVITLHVFGGKNIEKSLIQRAVEPNKLRNRIVSNGDIIIEKSGGTDNCSVGRVYLAEGISTPTTSVNFTNILKLNNELFDSHYIYELLNIFHRLRIAAKYEQKTVGIANLKQGEYFKLKYMFPNKKEQVVISKAIKRLDKEKKTLELILEKEQKRFDWMSDALLSGEYQIVD